MSVHLYLFKTKQYNSSVKPKSLSRRNRPAHLAELFNFLNITYNACAYALLK